jgi:hypothetical protein
MHDVCLNTIIFVLIFTLFSKQGLYNNWGKRLYPFSLSFFFFLFNFRGNTHESPLKSTQTPNHSAQQIPPAG